MFVLRREPLVDRGTQEILHERSAEVLQILAWSVDHFREAHHHRRTFEQDRFGLLFRAQPKRGIAFPVECEGRVVRIDVAAGVLQEIGKVLADGHHQADLAILYRVLENQEATVDAPRPLR